MKVNCWEKCFLCLTNLASTSSSSCGGKKSRGRPKQIEVNGKPNLCFLIKYLLGTSDQNENDSLLQRIRRLQQPNSTSSSEGLIKFCDNCQDSARRISHFQMELEVIQMKIVDILYALRKTVLGNSNGHHDGTSGLSFEEFTEDRREILDTLHAFQGAVVEKSKESVHVPLVYIEKFTGCNLTTNLSNRSPTAEEDEHLNLIKTEPEADSSEEFLSEFGDNDDYAPTRILEINNGLEDDDWQEEMDTDNGINIMPTESDLAPLASSSAPIPEPEIDLLPARPPRKLQKKEKEEKSPVQNRNLNPIIKEENSGDPTDGTRKARSAALTAVKRIADVKKLSRASFQYRTGKVSKRPKKTKQVETKRKSTRASSSSRHASKPPLKAGMNFKTPKQQGGKKLNARKAEQSLALNKKYFECEICPYKTVHHFQFEHHLTQHETPEVVNHICPYCTNPPRQFSQKQSFDYHMNSHSGLNKIGCDICSRFIDHFVMLQHLRVHHEVEKVFQCSCCSYLCGTREGYLKHIRRHGAASLVCDVCSKKFLTRKRMLEHIHREHNLLEKIKCDVANCDKEFLDSVTMKKHKRRHAEEFVCLECNLQFPTTRLLLGHQVRDHSMEKPYPCSECSERFIDKVSLENHTIRAHGAAKLKCPYCPKEFANRSILSSHMNLHDGISFPCDKCDKSFGDQKNLKRHKEVHKTTKDFVCEECGKDFRRVENLRTHIKIHIGDKKHKCSYCSKGFVDRKNLITHERIHTGEKPYVCEACGKDFNQRSALNVHRRTQHKELIAIKNKSEVTATGSTSTQDELNIS